ncbi:MAG: hypothetical protein SFV15_00560 [Polyangiaceae bacterium]|nr:hypothetical protein [Polyangiaceae bacterium]
MKKHQLDHVLRAAGRITGEKQFVIIGSQSLHGRYPDLPDDIVRSAEVDLIARGKVARTEWLNVIGQDSPFHEEFGYYADRHFQIRGPTRKGHRFQPRVGAARHRHARALASTASNDPRARRRARRNRDYIASDFHSCG